MKWPTEVPILEASDIHRGTLNGPRNTHCLTGWVYYVFNGYKVRERVLDTLRETARRKITLFNDDTDNSKGDVADVWNRAMADLGYTEIEEYEV